MCVYRSHISNMWTSNKFAQLMLFVHSFILDWCKCFCIFPSLSYSCLFRKHVIITLSPFLAVVARLYIANDEVSEWVCMRMLCAIVGCELKKNNNTNTHNIYTKPYIYDDLKSAELLTAFLHNVESHFFRHCQPQLYVNRFLRYSFWLNVVSSQHLGRIRLEMQIEIGVLVVVVSDSSIINHWNLFENFTLKLIGAEKSSHTTKCCINKMLEMHDLNARQMNNMRKILPICCMDQMKCVFAMDLLKTLATY